MGLTDSIRVGAAGVSTGYEVERSLRFNHPDNTYLVYQPSSDGNRQKWTWSGWVKRVRLGSTTYGLFTSQNNGDGGGNNGIASIYFGSDDRIHVYYDTTGSNHSGAINDSIYRDPSAWYHIVWQVDAANSTSKIFVNGISQSIGSGQQPVSGYNYTMNQSGKRMTYGIDAWDMYSPASIYVAECHYSDGQLYDADVFAEEDSVTGQWVPKASPAITYGTNGHYLNFSDNSGTTATTLGKDYSGNGNNFTPYNFSVAAWPANDSVVDTPTNNFATLNVLDKHGNVNTANGNLETNSTAGGAHFPIFTSMSMRGGKYYMEYKRLNNDDGMILSIMNIEHDAGSLNTDSTPGNNTSAVNKVGFGILAGSGRTSHNGTLTNYGSALGTNEIGMCAVDLDNGKIWWGKQGSFFNSGNPANGTNAAFTTIDTDTTWNFCFHVLNNNNLAINWGSQGFTYTPPTGFGRLCTADLPEVDIKNPVEHHETLLYTGNNGNQNVTGLDFNPAFVWAKNRVNAGYHHELYDTQRGNNKRIFTSQTSAEATGYLQFGQTGGFSLTSGGGINTNNSNHVAWCWDGGTSTVTNNSGSRTTQVRADQDVGFSIIEFNYGSGTQTLGHGLGKPPKWILAKPLNNSTNWAIYHSGLGANGWFNLNTNAATQNNAAVWNNQSPSNSLIYLGTGMGGQGDAVIYAWSEIIGFSAFGTYFGNGSTNGPYVHTGFQPAWLMYKNVQQNGGEWFIRDNKRETGNPNNKTLKAQSSGSEVHSSLVDTDFLSNGFKLRETNEGTNNSGIKYIFMAFAKHPVKYTRAV